jgi:FkbM family methyltransferase
MAARHHFPKSNIHCYEPNPDLERSLRQHCEPISVKVHMEAVAAQGGRVTLQRQENSLHSTVAEAVGDGLPCVAFSETIERLGGKVDLLKLDCEGAEWSLFEDVESWKRIGFLTMEYHLWAKPGSTLENLRQKLSELGFETLTVKASEEGSFGMLRARNRSGI